MARRVRPAAGLASLMGSDSDSDLGGIADGFMGGVKRTTTMKKQQARPTSSHRINKPTVSSTSWHTTKTTSSRTSPRRALVEKERSNVRPVAKNSSKALLSDNDSDGMELVDHFGSKEHAPPDSPLRRADKLTTTKSWASKQESVSPVAPPKNRDVHNFRDAPRARMPSTEIYEDKPQPKRLADASKYTVGEGEDSTSLRKQLDSLKRKYESLESRHEELKEVAVKEAERNYERLKRHTEESSSTAERLIAQLKEEVKDQTAAAGDADRLRRKLEESQAYGKELLGKISNLNSALVDSEREVKTLTAKLAANRSTEANRNVPGSAVKGNNAKTWTGQSELVHQAHAKEDLYSDLTGLIIRSIEQGDKEDVFDCLQTGRNGTLHFKLALEKQASNRYEDMMFSYQPQLQEDRDAELIETLPEFLLEDIEFKRPQAPNFYSRVIKGLVDKRRGE